MFSLEIADCPSSYIEKYGDINGAGIEKTSAEYIDECKERCSNNELCCAFEFSSNNKECQLHQICEPDNDQFGDYIVCQKSKLFYIFAFYNLL